MVTATMTTINVFDPLCCDKGDIENSLRQNFGDCSDVVNYKHPYSDSEECIFYPTSDRIKWERVTEPVNVLNILDNSDQAGVGDRIEERILYFKEKLGLTKKRNITVQPIPDGQESLICSVDEKIPFVFAVSFQYGQDYFDTLVHDMTEYCDDDDFDTVPVFYGYTETEHFRHSGDYKRKGNLLHSVTLKEKREPSTGFVSVHAYNKKSFTQIQYCDPCVAIVDCVNENDVIIYIRHFSLSKDVVKDNSICHLAQFNYCSRTQQFRWYFPQPVFDNSKFNVGSSFKGYYDKKIPIFRQNVKHCSQKEKGRRKRNPPPPSFEQPIHDERLLLIQKPILHETVVKDFLSRNNNGNALTFHTRINELDDDDEEEERGVGLNACQFSLPIAGGAIVSEKPTVKLGRPIKKRKTLLKMRNFLEKSNKRPIVLLTNKSSCANVPDVNSKMDAIYVVIALDEEASSSTVNERLNSVDASLAIAMQGSLSSLFVYLSSTQRFYYFRGVCDGLCFGDVVTIDDILKLRETITQPRPLVTLPFPEQWSVYSKKLDRVLFNVTNRDNPETIIEKIISIEKDDWSYVFSQLEVNLKSTIFNDMIDIILKKLKSEERISQRECLETFLKNEKEISKFPKKQIVKYLATTRDDDDGIYSKKWLTEFMATLLKYEDKMNFMRDYQRTLQEMTKIINHKKDANQDLYDILINCVPMRSAYGIRKKGIQQVMRKKLISKNCQTVNNVMTMDDMDTFFINHCSREGVMILQVNPCHFLRSVSIKNDDDDDDDNNVVIKKLTYRYTNFDSMNSEFASTFLDSVKFDFNYNENAMMIIPIVDDLITAMENPNKFNWNHVTEGGSIELARIILRKTIYNLIPESVRNEKGIISPGDPIIGKIIINKLFSAIYNLVGDRTDFSESDEGDGVICKLRCLTGLILSIMASGTIPLSSAYEVVLRKNLVVTPNKIKFNQIDGVWIKNLINIWPYLNYKNSDLNIMDNVSNCIRGKLQDYVKSIKELRPSKKEKKMMELKEKATLEYEFTRPLVLKILEDHDDDNDDYDVEEIKNYLKNYQVKKRQSFVRKPICKDVRYYVPTVKKVTEVLKLYSDLQDDYKIKNYYFASCLERLKKICNDEKWDGEESVVKNDKVLKAWDQVYSTALEKYLRKSQFIPDQLLNMKEYLSKPSSFTINEANHLRDSILRNIFKFKTKLYDHVYLPHILILLSTCQELMDYELMHLEQYIEVKSKDGDFMKNYYISENVKVKNRVNAVVNKIKKDGNIWAMAKWFDKCQNREFNVHRLVREYI